MMSQARRSNPLTPSSASPAGADAPQPVDTDADADADERQVIIVANPYSGAKHNREQVSELVPMLARHRLQARIVWDLAERRTLLQDPQVESWCRCVVVAGGDGTVASVINEPLTTPLAVLPLGNENLLARELGFTAGPAALAGAIAAGRCRRIDLGLAHQRRFSLMLSAGFDADVVHRLDRWRTQSASPATTPGGGQTLPLRRVRHRSYVMPVLRSLCSYRHEPIELVTPDARVSGTHVLIFNLPRYGGGVHFLPQADGSDGMLDWIVFQKPGVWRMLDYLQSIRRGVHLGRSDVQHGRASSIKLEGCPAPVQADGDPLGVTPLEVRALPGALCVIDATAA